MHLNFPPTIYIDPRHPLLLPNNYVLVYKQGQREMKLIVWNNEHPKHAWKHCMKKQ